MNTARLAKPLAVALHHVIAETDLAHLAVGDDVDAGLALLANRFRDRLGDAGLELALIDGLLVDDVPHHAREVGRPGQAAGMRGLNPIGVPFHGVLPGSQRLLSACWFYGCRH
jgi:hypothetical protein